MMQAIHRSRELCRAVHDHCYLESKSCSYFHITHLTQWWEEQPAVCLITVLFAAYANKTQARNSYNGFPVWARVVVVTALFFFFKQNRGHNKRVMLYKTWGGKGALWIVSHLRFYCLGQGICIWGIVQNHHWGKQDISAGKWKLISKIRRHYFTTHLPACTVRKALN